MDVVSARMVREFLALTTTAAMRTEMARRFEESGREGLAPWSYGSRSDFLYQVCDILAEWTDKEEEDK